MNPRSESEGSPGHDYKQLVSYIALSAPATRRPADGNEPYLRPEIGFTPRWFRESLDIDFAEPWHTDPSYRRDTIKAMSLEVERRFGTGSRLGVLQQSGGPLDILTGTFGAVLVAGVYGVPIEYKHDDWPWARVGTLTDEAADSLEPPDLDENPFWSSFLGQLDWIAEQGPAQGFINWQGVLNNSFRLRGNKIFTDLLRAPERVKHVFECVTETMIEGMRRLYEIQASTGFHLCHSTISNCLVNMLSPGLYRKFHLPLDQRIARSFDIIGVHNCAWNADPYLDPYSEMPNVAYIDMGMESNLSKARNLFGGARRAIMYTPKDATTKPSQKVRSDLVRISEEYGPCDVVFADIDAGTPDDRVRQLIAFCREISKQQGHA